MSQDEGPKACWRCGVPADHVRVGRRQTEKPVCPDCAWNFLQEAFDNIKEDERQHEKETAQDHTQPERKWPL